MFSMEHRHLNHTEYSLAAIDDIIQRGGRQDWVALRNAATSHPDILKKILRVCLVRLEDPTAQRYHLWSHYAHCRVA